MQTLLIIDGNAIVHRAFHAYPPQLITPEGKQINAVYGWFAMLIKVLEEVKPEYLAVTFDLPAPTFRKQLFAGYQSHRPQMADGLSEQIAMLHEGLRAIGIPIFEIDGYEADDVIGTLSVQAKALGIDSMILSGDRDLLQLVNDHVQVFMPIVGITKFMIYNSQKVEEKYGIAPHQFIDYKALVGDASDGYPGVAGIGPKTAADLIKKFGSFDNLYLQIKEVPEKTAIKLATDAEQGALAKKLATIALDAPVHLDLAVCDVNLFEREKVLTVFDKFGFNSIKKRVNIFREASKKIPKQVSSKGLTQDDKKDSSRHARTVKNENQMELL